jgi:hypothetical protein
VLLGYVQRLYLIVRVIKEVNSRVNKNPRYSLVKIIIIITIKTKQENILTKQENNKLH